MSNFSRSSRGKENMDIYFLKKGMAFNILYFVSKIFILFFNIFLSVFNSCIAFISKISKLLVSDCAFTLLIGFSHLILYSCIMEIDLVIHLEISQNVHIHRLYRRVCFYNCILSLEYCKIVLKLTSWLWSFSSFVSDKS